MSAKPRQQEIPGLSYYAERGGCTVIAGLLDRYGTAGIDSVVNEYGSTALMLAARAGHEDIVRLLLKRGASMEQQEDAGPTALLSAVFGGQRNIVALLLERGALIDAKGGLGRTALMWACYDHQTNIVALLLEKGASIEMRDDWNGTAMGIAQCYGYSDIVALIRQKEQKIYADTCTLTEDRLKRLKQLPKPVLKRGR